MTDQTTPDVTDGDRSIARDWAEHIINTPEASLPMETAAARVLLEVLPKRPTLADMTDEERAACLRMQCDTGPNRSVRGFIADIYPGGCLVIERDTWEWRSYSDELVTPRPDLPCLEWPGTEKPAPAPALPDGWRLADHPQRGRVIVTNTEPDVHGDVWFVRRDPYGGAKGYDVGCCKPAKLTYIDEEGDQ